MELAKTKSFKLAFFTRGDKNSDKLAILLPGRLDTKDYGNFVSHAEYLSSRGFFVIAIDPPGTWESSGNIEIFTTTNYIKAVNELIEFFGNKPTWLVGHSRGATVAILTCMSNKSVMGIISVMANFGAPTAPSDEELRKGFHTSFRDMPPGTTKTIEQKKFELPISYWEDGEKYNPAETVKKCTKPKLIIYGLNDEFTPTSVVEELYKEIPEPKMLREINAKHDYRLNPGAIEEVNRAIGEFLDS